MPTTETMSKIGFATSLSMMMMLFYSFLISVF